MNIDLHSHSTHSDGALSVRQLAARAKARGLDAWALTDHDTVAGLAEAREQAQGWHMAFVPGVEISTRFEAQPIHVLGLGIDPQAPELVAGLQATRAQRRERAQRMAARLQACGIEGALAGARALAGDEATIGRVHFARFLVARGVCRDRHEAFQRYLGDHARAFVPTDWAPVDEVVGWILAAGGKAVIAHPGAYHLDAAAEHALFAHFLALGGVGLEVQSSSHTAEQVRGYARLALEHGFEASRGSDFHVPGVARTELGHLPALPADLVPIWHDWDLFH